MDAITPAPSILSKNGGRGNATSPHQIIESPPERQKFYGRPHFVRVRKALLSCRARVQDSRRALVTERGELRQLRREIEVLEDEFVSACESAQAGAQPKLSEILAEMKAMRKDLKSREHAHNIAEDRLYSDEYDLRDRENEFYGTFGPDFDEESQASSVDLSSSTPEKLHATDQLQESLENTNPLYYYQSKIGWANYLHDKILDMIYYREEILEEQRQQDPSNRQMNQDDRDFLETYGEKFANMVGELDALEDEILNLEKGAINDRLLDPSDVYSRPRCWMNVPAAFGAPAIDASDQSSEVSSVMKVPVNLPDPGKGHATPAKPSPRFQLPTVYIRQWLKNLRLSPGVRVREFWTQIDRSNQGEVVEVQNGKGPSSISDMSVAEQSEKNWVYVVKASSEPTPDVPSHSQDMTTSMRPTTS